MGEGLQVAAKQGILRRFLSKNDHENTIRAWVSFMVLYRQSFVTSRVLPTSSHSFIVSTTNTVFITENRIRRGLRGLFHPAWHTAQS